MRLFYVLYPENEPNYDLLWRLLDGLRFAANPKAKHVAHITVRGPYTTEAPEESYQRWNSLVPEIPIRITGVSKFEGTSTVFFKCDAPDLKQIWGKPSFPDEFNPHITIYDGDDTEWAEQILQTAEEFTFNFRFNAKHLWPLVSVEHEFQETPLRQKLRERIGFMIMAKIPGESLSVDNVETMSKEKRLELIRRIFGHLARRK